MRLFLTALLCCAVAAVGSVGCGPRTSTTGGEKKTTTGSGGVVGTVDKEFKMTVPKDATEIEQGKSKDVTITFSFGKDFDGKLKLGLKAGKGLKVDPESVERTKTDKELKVTVTAEKTAEGESDVTVTATPPAGDEATAKIAIKVKKAG